MLSRLASKIRWVPMTEDFYTIYIAEFFCLISTLELQVPDSVSAKVTDAKGQVGSLLRRSSCFGSFISLKFVKS